MAAKKHTLLYLGGGAAALFGGYEFLYKPWKMAQDAALIAAGQQPSSFTYTGGGGGGGGYAPVVTSPSVITGITPSNLDPGAAVGGEIGACMHYKGWTQQQCTTRLASIRTAYNNAVTELASLQNSSQGQATAAIAATQAALTGAMANLNADLKSGDAAGADNWRRVIAGHQADLADLNARVATIPARIAAIQGAVAGWKTEYTNLTHMTLA